MEYTEQLIEWFCELEDDENVSFKQLTDDEIYNKCQQVSALEFMTCKLKDPTERFFLHGEHDELLIGNSFDTFEEFTYSDVKIAVAHGISVDYEDEGFRMYASM